MTRQDQSQAVVEWMQGTLGEEDPLANIVRIGMQELMEAERDVHVGRSAASATS